MPDYFAGDPKTRCLADLEELRQRFDVWQRQVLIWDRMEYPPKPPKEEKTSNENMSNATYVSIFIRAAQVTYVNRMDRAEPYIEVALEETGDSQGESQARKSAHVERFCYGMLNTINDKAVRQVKGTSMMRQLYSSSGNPGKIVQFLHMRKKKDGTAEPVWEIIDPYNCYHDFDQQPFRFVREYFQSASTVRAEYEAMALDDGETHAEGYQQLVLKEKDNKNPDVHVVNHWVFIETDTGTESWNTCLVDDKLLFHRKTTFKRRPYQVIVTNSSPRTYQNIQIGASNKGVGTRSVITDDKIKRHAEPFWAPLEPTIEQLAEGMSLLMKAVALMVNQPFLHFSQTGNEVKGNAALKTPSQEVTLSTDLGEDIKILDVVKQVPDALGVLNYLVRDMERIVPSAAFGQTAVSGESGYLYDKRSRDAALVAFADPARAASVAIQMGLAELLEQFREGDMKIKLSAVDVNGDSAGKMWYRNFNSSDIPESFVIKVRVAPELPDDDAKAAQIATMLKQSGLMDDRTIMSKILGIKDPLAAMERIKQQRADALPMMDILHAIENLAIEAEDYRLRAQEAENDGRKEFARLYRFNAAKLDEWRKAFEAQIKAQPALPAPQGQPLNGPSPEVLPPEQYNNPDEKAGAMGEVSSSLAGRPPSKNGGAEQ